MIKYFCDGCEVELNGDLSKASNQAQEEGQSELFCDRCLDFSLQYWKEKKKVVEKASEEYQRVQQDLVQRYTDELENHRRLFFEQCVSEI